MKPRLLPCLALAALLLLGALAAPAFLSDAVAGPRSDAARLVRGLETRRLSNVAFEDVGLDGVVKWLRIATGYNIVLKRGALAKASIDPTEISVTLQLEDVTVAQLLNILLEPHELAVQVKGNVVYVTTRVDALGRPITRLYAISHITYTKTDFIAPEINLRPSDYSPANDYEPEQIVEDDPLNSGDAVADLIRELVVPEEWDSDGWNLRATDRYLVVRAPRAVQDQVLRALSIIASLK